MKGNPSNTANTPQAFRHQQGMFAEEGGQSRAVPDETAQQTGTRTELCPAPASD